ncbi:MAG: alpha/beta fold hydrolase [Verrucomicrobia bacterium]|nr:MAG: alpha/beta fold hydrolase [Verrucomicrobiota bacterium]TAE87459.1 MAG: alpha/beta fold hydrolase [Verrucomicrobiota bacterium]TAF25742.1 MAG: alpha/beta fold hydrolase [Verrucomicrobiota bacterium]TAF41529.1 MAG: alpha/beta fold hydrolase [Verrucomicrobiota bacterium]
MDLPEFRNRSGEKLDTSFHPASREDVLVILGHGLTGNKDRPLLLALAEGLAARGWPCLRISYSGNGASEGDFREATITKESGDLRAILDALPPNLKIAYAGHSMGGAVGLTTAADDERIRVLVSLAGMVRTDDFCEREFGSVSPDKGCMWEDPEFPLSQHFVDDLTSTGDLFDEAARVSAPWLLIHGTEDDVVLIEDSRDAYDTAEEPKRLVEIRGAGHSFDENSYPQVVAEVADWLDAHLR